VPLLGGDHDARERPGDGVVEPHPGGRTHNYDRLHGELDWHTPAERFDGTPFTAHGFERGQRSITFRAGSPT
jgi:hypothetical protein